MHSDEIAIEDAGIAHAHALHPQKKVRRLLEQAGIDLIPRFYMFFGQNRLETRRTTKKEFHLSTLLSFPVHLLA